MGSIGQPTACGQEKQCGEVAKLLAEHWPAEGVRRVMESCGVRFRKCVFLPWVTLRTCIMKHLEGLSARDLESRLCLQGVEINAQRQDGKDFCNARARLPLQVFEWALRSFGERLRKSEAGRWHDLWVGLVDGTTTVAPRTHENILAFGGASNQHGASRLPLVRVVLLVIAGAVCDLACGPYAASELALWALILQRLPSGGVWVADRLFDSFLNFGLTRARGSHVLCRRRHVRARRAVRRWNRWEHLEHWHKPRPEHCHAPELLAELPEFLEVRVVRAILHRPGFRDVELVLCTTLLDRKEYPLADLVALYLRRWNIELDIRSLKAHHGLDRLTAHSPEIVLREIYSALLAFNLVRSTLLESGKPAYMLSHARILSLIVMVLPQLNLASRSQATLLRQRLRRLTGQALLDRQRRPPQPRAIVYRAHRFPFLTRARSTYVTGEIHVA